MSNGGLDLVKGLIKYNEDEYRRQFNNALDQFAKNVEVGFNPNENSAIQFIYSFSNENLDEMLDLIDLQDKSVLTVGSSGDQVLACLARGASRITLIDRNPMSLPYVELKIAGLKNLSFEEFNDYFTRNNIFNWKYYAKVSHDLSPQTREFWDTIYLTLGKKDSKYCVSLFQQGFCGEDCYKNHMHYKDKLSFQKAKQNLNDCEIDFYEADLTNFPSVINEKYDVMLLSNVADYVNHDEFFKTVFMLNNFLNKNGQIQLMYDFDNYFGIRRFVEELAKYTDDKKLISVNNDTLITGTTQLNYKGVNRVVLDENLFKNTRRRPVATFVSKDYLDSRKWKLLFRKCKRIQYSLMPKSNKEDSSLSL